MRRRVSEKSKRAVGDEAGVDTVQRSATYQIIRGSISTKHDNSFITRRIIRTVQSSLASIARMRAPRQGESHKYPVQLIDG